MRDAPTTGVTPGAGPVEGPAPPNDDAATEFLPTLWHGVVLLILGQMLPQGPSVFQVALGVAAAALAGPRAEP